MKNLELSPTKKEQSIIRTVAGHLKNASILLLLYLTLNQMPYYVTELPFFFGNFYGIPRVFSIMIAIVLLFLMVVIGYKVAKRFNLVNLTDPFTNNHVRLIIVAFLIEQVIGYTSLFLQRNLADRTASYSSTVENGSGITAFLALAIVLPIIEEIIYRGFIMGAWLKLYPKIGLIVSAFCFTLIHVPNSEIAFLQYFLKAILYGVVYLKCRRLEVTMGMHILNNLPGGLQMLFHLF